MDRVRELVLDAVEVEEWSQGCYWSLFEAYRRILEDYIDFLVWVKDYPSKGDVYKIIHLGHTCVLWFVACWDWIGFYLKNIYDLDIADDEVNFSVAYEELSRKLKEKHIKLPPEKLKKMRKLEKLYKDSKPLRDCRHILTHRYDNTYWFVEKSISSVTGKTLTTFEGIQDTPGTRQIYHNLRTLLESAEEQLFHALKICRFLATG